MQFYIFECPNCMMGYLIPVYIDDDDDCDDDGDDDDDEI